MQPDNPSGSVEDMRNYNKLEGNIREMLQTILVRDDPVAAIVEIRYNYGNYLFIINIRNSL